MIAKISATKNLKGTLGYNFKKVREQKASVLLANGLFQEESDAWTMNKVLADMQACIPNHCRTKKTVFHCSLNPHPDDTLSDDTLCQIAKAYMEELGYGNQPYIVFKHNDIAREHIHIVSLRVDSNGRKINDLFEKRRSKKITNALEKKYHLTPSSKATKKNATEMLKIDVAQGNIKKQLANTVRTVLKQYTFCSLGELNAILSHYQLAVEEVKTEFKGKQYDGLVYVPTDNNGSKISTPVNASEIGRGVGYTAVENRMKKSKTAIKSYIPNMRKSVLQVMKTSPKTVEAFQDKLSKKRVRAYIRTNDSGHIYGITFIDDKKGIALNGSRLGKGYSATVFNNYWNGQFQYNPFLNEALYGSDLKTTEEIQAASKHIEEMENNYIIEEILDDIFDIPTSTGNDDWKETAWQRKLRRQHSIRRRKKKW